MDDKKLSECSFEELLTAAFESASKREVPMLAFSGEKEGMTRMCITGMPRNLAELVVNGMESLEKEHPVVTQLMHALYYYRGRKDTD